LFSHNIQEVYDAIASEESTGKKGISLNSSNQETLAKKVKAAFEKAIS